MTYPFLFIERVTKCGYSLEEAAGLAESTSVLLNVSEFQSIEDATSALTSTLQAFSYTADESMHVVDILNEVGNNFAISSDGIATALQDSASSLMAANNSYEEAVALIAAANRVVQDPNSVGAALRTISLRLRGTSVEELEEAGEDTTGVVTSKSKLRGKVKSLSGVDILTDTGAYKSTYDVLLEISKVWEDMSDIDQAALLEIIAGKTRSNTAAAILSNTKDLEEAFKSAQEAEGSALAENEKYLDSIQGRIDLFNNAMQTMWNNTLDSELVKGVVNLGTEFIKIIDEIGLINSLLIGFGVFATKKYNLFGNIFGNTNDIKSIREEYEELEQEAKEASETFAKNPNKKNEQKRDRAIKIRDDFYDINLKSQDELINKQAVAQEKLEKAKTRLANAQAKEGTDNAVATATMKKYESAVRSAEKEVNDLNEEIREKIVLDNVDKETTEGKTATTFKELAAQILSGKVTKENIAATLKQILVNKLSNTALGEKIALLYGVEVAELGTLTMTQLLTGGFKALGTAIWTALAPFLPFIAGAAALVGVIALVVKGIDNATVTAEEAKEKLEDLNTEINSLTSDLDSLNSKLETIQERMEELLSKDTLSFVEQEELNNLKLQNEQLERQIELQKLLLEQKKNARTSAAKDVIKKTWDSKSFGKEDYQVDLQDGVIKKDDAWSIGRSGKDAIEKGLEWYAGTKQMVETTYNSYLEALNEYGSEHWITKDKKKVYDEYQNKLNDQANGINMVLEDMSNIIVENELQYGDDKEINKYLDEYYAMVLKWQEAQGVVGKSDIIKGIFNTAASDGMQDLKEQLDEIAGSDLDNATKQTRAQELIQDAINSTDEDYQRLKTTMDTLGISADELAESFIAVSGAPDIGTLGGVFEIFADGEEILSKFNDKQAELGTDESGESITWDNLFKEVDGKKVADNLKVSAILEGADEDVRDQFTKIIEEVENGTMGVDEALAKWELSGIHKMTDVLNTEFESLNNELFPDAADEISGLIDTLDELKAAFESVANTMDTFKTAQEEMNSTGRVSIKTALELMSATDNWDKILNITEDTITLVIGSEEELMEMQLKQISEQMNKAAELAKYELDVAREAKAAAEAFEAETQAANNLNDAEGNVMETQDDANVITNARTQQMGELQGQTNQTGQSEIDYANNEGPIMSAEGAKAKAIGLVSAMIIGLDAALTAFNEGTFFGRWGDAAEAFYGAYTQAKVETSGAYDIEALEKKAYQTEQMANLTNQANTYEKFNKNYSKDSDSGSDKDDAFQKEMDYWENRIAANQAKYEQIQNEIDLLEKQGKIAGKEYYEEQIRLENERLELLEGQRKAAQKYLGTFKEGSEEWWEVASTLNDIEGEIDDVTASLQDLSDAIAEIDWKVFDETHTRYGNLINELETVRTLLAPNGEEDWFDDDGMWTEKGVAVAGAHIQQIEIDQNALDEVNKKLEKYSKPYEGNEKYYKKLGIDSEQELYDAVEKLRKQQHDYTKDINDNRQAVVDMYKAQIDAIEEYTNKLIDSYNEYIDVLHEALDAERDLYEFKKDVEKQTKNISSLDRRIASLSGSTDAADIAERRKLEAERAEARENLDDTYYNHSRDTLSKALDEEAAAYEEIMNQFIEGLRESLNTALLDMDLFMDGVSAAITSNAPAILEQYNSLGISLSSAIVDPWADAAQAIKDFSGEKGLGLMNSWINEGGIFPTFKSKATDALKSPWDAGKTALNSFKTSISTEMKNIVSNIESNVSKAKTSLSSLTSSIQDTSKKASTTSSPSSSSNPSNTPSGGGNNYNANVAALQTVLNSVFSSGLTVDGIWGSKTKSALEKAQTKVKNFLGNAGYRDLLTVNGKFDVKTRQNMLTYFDKMSAAAQSNDHPEAVKTYVNAKKKLPVAFHAKGTLGTKKDEWAITDESWIGEEITLAAGKNGQLQYLKKGSAVMPADISANLVEWGKLNPNSLSMPTMGGVSIMNNAIMQPNFEMNFDSLVHVDHCDEGTLKSLEKMIDTKINDFGKQLNYSIKKFAR